MLHHHYHQYLVLLSYNNQVMVFYVSRGIFALERRMVCLEKRSTTSRGVGAKYVSRGKNQTEPTFVLTSLEVLKPYHPYISRGTKPYRPYVSRGTKPYHPYVSRGTKPYHPYISRGIKPYHPYISRGMKPYHPYVSRGTKPYHPYVSRGTKPYHPYISRGNESYILFNS